MDELVPAPGEAKSTDSTLEASPTPSPPVAQAVATPPRQQRRATQRTQTKRSAAASKKAAKSAAETTKRKGSTAEAEGTSGAPRKKRAARGTAAQARRASAAMASVPRTASMVPKAYETVTVGKETLEDTPRRMTKFLMAVVNQPELRAALEPFGFNDAEYARGWSFLMRQPKDGLSSPTGAAQPKSDAASSLETWMDPNLVVAELALRHRHPGQRDFVFADPAPSKSDPAPVAVGRFLARLNELESSPERASTRDADRQALETLAARGITTEVRARLAAAVSAAWMLRMRRCWRTGVASPASRPKYTQSDG